MKRYDVRTNGAYVFSVFAANDDEARAKAVHYFENNSVVVEIIIDTFEEHE